MIEDHRKASKEYEFVKVVVLNVLLLQINNKAKLPSGVKMGFLFRTEGYREQIRKTHTSVKVVVFVHSIFVV